MGQRQSACVYEWESERKIEEYSNMMLYIYCKICEVRTKPHYGEQCCSNNIGNDYVHHGCAMLLRINCFVQTITSSWNSSCKFYAQVSSFHQFTRVFSVLSSSIKMIFRSCVGGVFDWKRNLHTTQNGVLPHKDEQWAPWIPNKTGKKM